MNDSEIIKYFQSDVEVIRKEHIEKKNKIIKQVKELCAKSHSYNEIGRILHLDRKTIRKYANMNSELNLESIRRNTRSSLDDYHNEMLQFLHDHYKTKEIYKLLKDLGYTGKYSTLKWYVTKI